MRKAISFDLWVTLINGNPKFKKEKCELIRNYFKVTGNDEKILNAFIKADKLLDNLQEKFLLQPEHLTAWAVVLHEIGIEQTSVEEIKLFLQTYNRLFLEYPPILLDDVEWLFEKLFKIERLDLYILSNTILVIGETLDKFVKTTCLREIKAYYSDTHFPKPDCRAFETLGNRPFIHVGDNIIADGKCKDFGVEFYQVRTNGKSLKDFWQYIEPRL